MKYINCLLAILLLSTIQAGASHLMGGELSYAYNGSNYVVTLHLYRDCSGIQLPGSATITIRYRIRRGPNVPGHRAAKY